MALDEHVASAKSGGKGAYGSIVVGLCDLDALYRCLRLATQVGCQIVQFSSLRQAGIAVDRVDRYVKVVPNPCVVHLSPEKVLRPAA